MTDRMHMILWQSIMQPMDYENALKEALKAVDYASLMGAIHENCATILC